MKKILITIVIVCTTALAGFSQEEEQKDPPPIAFIFNTSNLFDAPQSYQGGVGIKYLTDSLTYRCLGDLYYSQETGTVSAGLGVALEKHLYDSFISPYYGFSISASVSSVNTDYIEELQVPIEAGPILGVELFVTEYVSLFAEYYAGVSYNYSRTTVPSGADEITTEETYFSVDTGIGNHAQLGITIYLGSQVEMPE